MSTSIDREVAMTALCVWEFIIERDTGTIAAEHTMAADTFLASVDVFRTNYGTASLREIVLNDVAPWIEGLWGSLRDDKKHEFETFDWDFVPLALVRFVRFTDRGEIEFIPGG